MQSKETDPFFALEMHLRTEVIRRQQILTPKSVISPNSLNLWSKNWNTLVMMSSDPLIIMKSH